MSGIAGIRPFDAADIAGVAELHRQMNRADKPMTDRLSRAYHDYLRAIFLENPWRRDDLPSLVSTSRGGEIQGFIGVVPRAMMVGGETITAAVSSQLIVAEKARSAFVGLRLLRDFLAGTQDVAFADEANDKTRAIWTRLGGTVTPLHSISWLRPLRPLGYLLTAHRFRGFRRVATPAAKLLDAFAFRLLQGSRQSQVEGLSTREPTGEEMIDFMRRQETDDSRPAHADYTAETMKWTLGRAQKKSSFGSLRTKMVTASDGTALGWYAFYNNPGDVAEVIHLTARPGVAEDVFEVLTEEARREGVVALAGRCDADFLPVLAKTRCLLHPTGRWVLLHSTRPELVEAFRDANTRLSRLDGEFVLGFEPGVSGMACGR